MLISCTPCKGTGASGGVSCTVCSGDGEIDLTDANFRGIRIGDQITLMGIVWDSLLTSASDIEDKVDAMTDSIDAIIAEQDSLREDLTAALLQIWNKVKDL